MIHFPVYDTFYTYGSFCEDGTLSINDSHNFIETDWRAGSLPLNVTFSNAGSFEYADTNAGIDSLTS